MHRGQSHRPGSKRPSTGSSCPKQINNPSLGKPHRELSSRYGHCSGKVGVWVLPWNSWETWSPAPFVALSDRCAPRRKTTEFSAKVRRVAWRRRAERKEHLAKKPSYAGAGIATAPKWPVGCQTPAKTTPASRAGFLEAGACGNSIRDGGSQTSSERRPAQGLPLWLVPEGKVSSPFRAQKESPSGKDRKKHPNRVAVSLGSLLASPVGKAGGRMDA